MSFSILNDYLAHTYLVRSALKYDADLFRHVLSIYDSLSVRKLFLSYDYNYDLPFQANLKAMRSLSDTVNDISDCSVKLRIIPVVPLINSVVTLDNLPRLSVVGKSGKYLFIRIPPSHDCDYIISCLRSVIYTHKLTPVIVSTEKTVLTIPDKAVESLFRIPDAVYQMDLHSISSHTARMLFHKLVKMEKSVIFGTGDKFDLCMYSNIEYYTKFFTRLLGDDGFAYFTLRHNRFFA